MKRTHSIDLYAHREGETEDAYGKTVTSRFWELVDEDVHITLQPLTGSVEQTAAGRQIDSSYRLFAPPGVALEADQGVVVREVLSAGVPYIGPVRFRIKQVGSYGGRWDVEAMLMDTQESIP
jgi:hypothetical protein